MYLYSLTINNATSINNSVYGSFSGPNKHEIVVSKGKLLEMYRPDNDTGRLQLIYRQEMFGIIRKILPFRLLAMQKDFLVVGSDSGRIVFLEFDNERNKFVKIIQETFGKTGCRRIVPGEYLAVDPKGRAIMIGAIEKQKFVYILNRDSANKLTIQSPIDVHKPHTIIYDMCGVDVGIDNPQFACLEVDYGEADSQYSAVVTGQGQKVLTFYEMDLGVNNVIRKYCTPLDNTAHMLIQVPGEPDGPGGIIVVCSSGVLLYKKADHEDLEVQIPRRNDQIVERGIFMTCYTSHIMKDLFFIMIQSEYGDLYKVSLDYNKVNGVVHQMMIQYFDTIQPCITMNLLKLGFLFTASEMSNHIMYQFKNIGDEEKNPIVSYSKQQIIGQSSSEIIFFNPREAKNLQIVDELQNLASINDMKVEDLVGEGNPQFYLACGRGSQSTLRVLRYGLTVIEMAVSSMPQKPLNVITLKEKVTDKYDKFMVVSFSSQTIVLAIGEDKVSEVHTTGLYGTERTIHAGLLEDNSIVQVTLTGIIHIRSGGDTETKKRTKWESSKGKVLRACSNMRQVAISIEGGQIVYFELDDMSGQLNECGSRVFLDSDISCIDIGEVPEGRQRSRFLAVGYADRTVKIMSLDPESCLQRISTQALPAMPESVSLINFKRGIEDSQQQQLFLHVGLENGVLIRTVVDNVTGVLSDSRSRFLGAACPIKQTKIRQQHNQEAILALSNKPWFCYLNMNKIQMTPLSYQHQLECASSFSSEKCPEGIVGIVGNYLRIISIDRLGGDQFTQNVLPLMYTPCKLQIHPESKYIIILEKDHRCHSSEERKCIRESIWQKTNDNEYLNADESKIGYPKGPDNKFASLIRIVDPFSLQTVSIIEFKNNETVFSHFITKTLGNAGDTYLILGIGVDAKLSPRTCSLGFIYTYQFKDGGKRVELLHQTPCEDIPTAFNEYKGRLIVGVGSILRVYEMGYKKLLRKCENKNFQSPIISIQVEEGRIYAGDLQESVHVLKFKPEDVQLYIFADDVLNRWLTNFCLLDQDTIAGVDKFENVFVNRLPLGCEDDAEDDPTATKFKWENGYLNGAAFKMEQVCQFYIGEVGTCILKCSLTQGSQEVIVVGTTMGGICVLLPFENREDLDFFVHLEMYLRIEAQPLCGRDHVTFRSMYVPSKDVIDGDLCEMFSSLEFNKQRVLAEEMDRTPPEVMKKLENLRNKII